MRVVVSALVLLAVAIMFGCDNDENTVEPIQKFHKAYPVFYLKIDNGFRDFGVDSAQLTVNPDVGWLGPVRTDERGFVGTQASGTFITDLDTIYHVDDSLVVETTSVIFGFEPLQTYTFNFSHDAPFIWRDSFRAVYAVTVDSMWLRLSADTIFTTPRLDPARPPDTVLYKVQKNPAPTVTPPPNELIEQPLLYGWWFDSAFVVTDSAATDLFPPDSFTYDTISWGYWYRVDSFFLPPEPSLWCDSIDTIIVEDTLQDPYGNRMFVIDTVFEYSFCDPVIDSLKRRIYDNWQWGTIASNGERVPRFDTTIHFTYPDTAKALAIDAQGLTIYTLEISQDSLDTTWIDTSGVDLYFIQNGDTISAANLIRELTMPQVEIYPAYKFLIKQRND